MSINVWLALLLSCADLRAQVAQEVVVPMVPVLPAALAPAAAAALEAPGLTGAGLLQTGLSPAIAPALAPTLTPSALPNLAAAPVAAAATNAVYQAAPVRAVGSVSPAPSPSAAPVDGAAGPAQVLQSADRAEGPAVSARETLVLGAERAGRSAGAPDAAAFAAVFDGESLRPEADSSVVEEVGRRPKRDRRRQQPAPRPKAPRPKVPTPPPAPAPARRPLAPPGDLRQGRGGQELLSALHEQTGRVFESKGYKEARHYMYATADNVEVGGRRGIVEVYSQVFVPGTGQDGSKYSDRGDEDGDGFDEHEGLNAEHVWPQSFFEGKGPMRSDLHHLMPTFTHPNSERGHYPFGEVTGTPEYHNKAGAKLKKGVFEPPDAAKGRIARAMLYFYTRYYDRQITAGGYSENFWNQRIDMFLRWNREHPPDEHERRRNDLVERFQGNRNPYIDDPSLADLVGAENFTAAQRRGGRRYSAVADPVTFRPDPAAFIQAARLQPWAPGSRAKIPKRGAPPQAPSGALGKLK